MHKEFRLRVERLTLLVQDDPQGNRGDILEEMKGFAHQHEALRFFLATAIANARYRTLSSAQSFFLFGNDHFRMRINAWYPQAGRTGNTKERFETFFSIDRCHNHSADLFTVGVFGPGYTTQFKESSQDLKQVVVGDRIAFDRVWDDQLEMGRALFIPKSTVFHTQFCPSEYSMSLNLVIDQTADCLQFELENDRETVRRVFDLIDLKLPVSQRADA